jgi:Family of unknown function (DUF5715)
VNFVIFLFGLMTPCLIQASRVKVFPATHDSVAEENRRADELGYRLYLDMEDVSIGIASGELVPITGVKINAKLPKDRRFLRPEAESFLERLNRDCGSTITVDSAVRPATVQRRLIRFNKNAAPYDGDRASSHERGSTFDIAKQGLTRRQERFLQVRLLYYRVISRVLVIEERGCYHVFVGEGDYLNDVLIYSPVGGVQQTAPTLDVLQDSSVGTLAPSL